MKALQRFKAYYSGLPGHKKGFWLVSFSVLTSSFYGIYYTRMSKLVGAEEATVMLYSFSLVFCLPTFFKEKIHLEEWKRFGFPIFLLAILMAAGNYSISRGMEHVTAGMAQTLQRSEIFFGAFLGWYFFSERLTTKLWFCLSLAGFGIVLMRLHIFSSVPQGSWVDYVSVLFGTFLYALAQAVAKRIVGQMRPNTINAYRLLLSVIWLWAVFMLLPTHLHYNTQILMYAAICGFCGPYATRALLFYGVKYLPLNSVFFLVTTTPIFTMLLQLLIFGERTSLTELLGSILILASVVLFIYNGKIRQKRDKTLTGSNSRRVA